MLPDPIGLQSFWTASGRAAARIAVLCGIWLAAAACATLPPASPPAGTRSFDAERAYRDIDYQLSLGPRIPASSGHAAIVEWIVAELMAAGWTTEVQQAEALGHPIRNVIGRRPGKGGPWILLGAHYDTRIFADKDPDPALRQEPVPGANDGASGVAVLLELARALPTELEPEVWLVFFDAEDNGGIDGWDWILGSQVFVERLTGRPDAVVIVDMVGDADLNLYWERNSDARLRAAVWSTAAELGYSEQFIASPKYAILDDHTPFLRAGIPAVDIIDFDFPYHHTTADTLDKVSADSLRVVGEVLLAWVPASGLEPAE